jgi:16S rRNA (cytidine1402-2'-O)-methyltransferase
MKHTSKGVLHVVSTPIGNLEDMTFRAVRVLKESALIAAEDTRVTAKLTRRYDIGTRLVSIRGKSAGRNMTLLLDRLAEGDDVALVTDAGTPSVSDPGFELVTAAMAAGIRVSPIPGPSALTAAVAVSGLNGEGVRFHGFLPRSGQRRKDLLSAIACDSALSILYESPKRLGRTLAELAASCDDRAGTVLRELTKLNEEIVTGPLGDLAERFASDAARGEITIVIEGARTAPESTTEEDLRQMIQKDLAAGCSTKDIVQKLSQGLGVSRKRVYQLALEELAARG